MQDWLHQTTYKILIIDDDYADRALYYSWLNQIKNCNYELFEANSGRLGLLAYEKHQPDCILLDYVMQDKDGFEFLKALQKRMNTISCVIFMTGNGTTDIEERAYELGVYDYLNKNELDAELLNERILAAVREQRVS